MPQVDFETLVCGGSDRKVACETLIDAATAADDWPDPAPPPTAAEAEDADLPPESVEVPIGSEGIDWASLNAVYERDDSTKGNTNPKSNHSNPNPKPIPRSGSNTTRTNLNNAKKTPIIALPGRFVPRRRRPTPPAPSQPQPPQPLPQGRIIPRAGAGAGSGTGADPGSPEVSCFGKVLSDRERGRRSAAQGGWCWAGLVAALGCVGGGGGGGGGGEDTKMADEEEVGGGSAHPHARDYVGNRGLKRFASGWRERDGERGYVAEGGEGRWGRGSVGLVVEEDAGRGTGGEREWEQRQRDAQCLLVGHGLL